MKTNKTAIIIHGGAIKGAFGAGVVYGLSQHGIQVADMVVGISSGVATASYFVSQQFEIIKQVWTKEIAKKEFVKYRDVLTGKAAFNLDYLINKLLRNKYPLNVETILHAKSELIVPLCRYQEKKIEFFSNHEPVLQKNFWDIFHAAITMHETHILWRTPWEPYADAELDPFALYRKEFIPQDWKVIVIANQHEMNSTFRKRLGLGIFLKMQARHFPKGAKEMLENRNELIRTGIKDFENFKAKYEPIIISPPQKMIMSPTSVIQRNNKSLEKLFQAGERAVVNMLANPQTRRGLEVFIERSKELSKFSSL